MVALPLWNWADTRTSQICVCNFENSIKVVPITWIMIRFHHAIHSSWFTVWIFKMDVVSSITLSQYKSAQHMNSYWCNLKVSYFITKYKIIRTLKTREPIGFYLTKWPSSQEASTVSKFKLRKNYLTLARCLGFTKKISGGAQKLTDLRTFKLWLFIVYLLNATWRIHKQLAKKRSWVKNLVYIFSSQSTPTNAL